MHDELAEIRDFIAECPPFDTLDVDTLQYLSRRLVIRYLRRGASFPPDRGTALWLLRQGAIELRTPDGTLARRMSEGDIHDADCLPASAEKTWSGHALEDSLLYGLPQPELDLLWQQHPHLRQQALLDLGERLAVAQRSLAASPERDIGSIPLARLITRSPVNISPEATIRQAAECMTETRVSALLIVDKGELIGILTDRDLRSRCLARGLGEQTAVSAVMTPTPICLPPDASGFEALLEMTRHGIHHLPVTECGQLHGLVSSTDLLRAQGASSIHLADRIRRADDLGQLAVLARELHELWLNLARRGEGAGTLGRIVAGIADAIACRLLQLAEQRLGPPPLAFAWIAFGSQGRQELTLHSDQDNALIFADTYQPEVHGDYFADLAREVCDGLAACGFALCPGEMMALNPAWRMSLGSWQATFTDWIIHTDSQKARLAANLFDFRVIHGDAELGEPLRLLISQLAPRHESFISHLAGNTCSAPPPIGFFRQLVVSGSGEHAGELDLKHHGLLPITDIARIHALAGGFAEVGTPARLRAAAGQLLSTDGAATLISAFDFLLALRTRHQIEQIINGEAPDNHIDPARLGANDRRHLRDVFLAIAAQQAVLLQAYPGAAIK